MQTIVSEMKKVQIETAPRNENNIKPFSQYANQNFFTIPPFIPELERLSLLELENLNKNEDLLNQFVDGLPQMTPIEADTEKLLENIETLASMVFSKEIFCSFLTLILKIM